MGLLTLVLFWIVVAAVNPSAAACHNAPLRVTRVPQLVAVLICVAGFVLGRVTARPKVRLRTELKTPVTASNDHESRLRLAVLMQAGLTGAMLFIACLIAFEAITLASDVWPITYYMRCAAEAASWQALTAAFAFCFLTGRWMWLPTTPEDGD
jgi:NAD/NADP transhydrogenase beta subunit